MFANENLYHSQDRINLKNKSPFDHSKKCNKKALADVGNVIRFKDTQSLTIKSSLHAITNDFNAFDQQKSLKSPNQSSKIIQKPKEVTLLENMDEEFFVCSCFSHDNDDFAYELPPSVQLTKEEIDNIAIRWYNPPPLKYDDEDSLTIMPISVEEDYPFNDDSASSSFMDVLNESLDSISPLPEITCQLDNFL